MFDDIELPEPKAFKNYEPAGLFFRFIAFLLDMFFISTLLFLVIDIKENIEEMIADVASNKFLVPTAILFLAYTILLESILGATLGKFILGLRVINENEERPHHTKVALRNFLKYLFISIPFITFFILFFMNIDRQFLHDSWSNCYIVQKKKKNAQQQEN